MTKRLGSLGGGNMAEAIVRSAISGGVLKPQDIIVSDADPQKAVIYEQMGVAFTTDNQQVLREASQIMLSVKPQIYPKLTDDLNAGLSADHILISIMAGLTTAKINAPLSSPARVVRVMPNTPVMVNLGMAGIAMGVDAQAGDDDLAYALFTSGGNQAVRVTEDKLDAITAVSGSGPAYVFYLAEAMQQAAKELGLGDATDLLVSQTILGAATLLSQSEDNATTLRQKVTSPGGTTQAAIESMEASGARDKIATGVIAACRRSIELGK